MDWDLMGPSGIEEPDNDAEAKAEPKKGGALTRRAFAALASTAALSLFLPATRAFAGVGGGAWGSYGRVAEPGSYYGYDGGWAYSNGWNVWLSVSCNATVGRMTELYLQISVASYFANGGIWSPTWFTDFADTHVESYIRNDGGAWLSSASGFYDTTYDSDGYHGPYVTDTHIVRRESWDWWSWAGVHAWCDSDDNAYGIDTRAEASQLIPHHILVDDAWWHNRLATLRPRNAPHLYMDTTAGGGAGTNVSLWASTESTNQNWIVGNSSQGRSCFIPVHSGNSPVFADIVDAVWDDGANVQVWVGNGSPAQSYYLHRLGAGMHLIVAECSGCAVDSSGGTGNNTNVRQWNCYGNWENPNQHWLLEEPVFHEAARGSMRLSGTDAAGVAEPGRALSAPNPQALCRPNNYGAEGGMYWRYAWYRSEGPWGRAEVRGTARGWNLGATLAEQQACVYVGTLGLGTGIETVRLRLADSEYPGALRYMTRSYGGDWQAARSEGQEAGEAGSGIMQIKIWLEGEIADRYDIDYRLFGVDWDPGPARNGEATAEPPTYSAEALSVRLVRKDTGAATLVAGPSEHASYVPTEADAGKYLTCAVTAHTRFANIPYRGEVVLPSAQVREPWAEVRYFADGEAAPCYSEQSRVGEPYHASPSAAPAGAKEGCAGFTGWFTDAACTVRYAEGTALQGDLSLYGYNRVSLAYRTSAGAFIETTEAPLFADEALSAPLDASSLYPEAAEYRYGETVTFAASDPAYFSDMGRVRTVSRVPGVYAQDPPAGAPMLRARLTRNAVVYCDWRAQAYDGVTLRQG